MQLKSKEDGGLRTGETRGQPATIEQKRGLVRAGRGALTAAGTSRL